MTCLLLDFTVLMRVLAIRAEEGRLAGRWRGDYAARPGGDLSPADCLVAACAVNVGATLATGNVADLSMAGLVVEHWPVGV